MHASRPTSLVSPLSLLAIWALALSLGGALAACAGDEKPTVTLSDAAAPDATNAIPDAAVCTQTTCGDLCVDTATDPLNCGGCGMACASAGQICSGSLPCECPADFVASQIGGGGFDQIQPQGDFIVGIAPNIGLTLDVAAVVWDLSMELGTEYNLADAVGALAPPAVAAGYDVDINTFMAHTAYAATEGIIIFDNVCDAGASGTMSNVVFSEVLGVTDPTPVEGGCSMSYESLTFNIGSCPITSDAGPGDGGPVVVPDAAL